MSEHTQLVYAIGLTALCVLGTLGFCVHLWWLALRASRKWKPRLRAPAREAERPVYRAWR